MWGVAALGDGVEEFGGFEEIAELLDGFFFDGFNKCLTLFGMLVDAFVFNAVFLKNLIGEEVHFFGEVLVKHKPQDVVAELIGVHFSAQGIGDVPELGFELFFLISGHKMVLQCLIDYHGMAFTPSCL